jgi:signal transduction histidine kinase
MDRTVLNSVVGQPVARLDILGEGGRIVYSTDHSRIGSISVLSPELDQLTVSSSEYVEAAQIRALDGQIQQMDVVESRIPVFQEAAAGFMGEPQSVFVVYRDVTSSVATATAASGRFRSVTIVGVMAVMFAALLLVVARGHVFAKAARARLEAMLSRERSLTNQLDVRNEELKATNDAKNRFLSVVTHELNTPLTSILAFADLLRRNRQGTLSERDVKQVEAISRSGQQMGLLIRDLLDLSRIESGTMTLETAEFDVRQSLSQVAETMVPIVRDRSQTLNTDLPHGEIVVAADRRRVEQVVTNLLSNASKYSTPGSRIWLDVEGDGESVRVRVRDEGIGISEDDRDRLFTPFYRAQNEETRRMPGTGLGLVICRQIAELHGGKLDISSVRGKGTTVEFTLPCRDGAQQSDGAAA